MSLNRREFTQASVTTLLSASLLTSTNLSVIAADVPALKYPYSLPKLTIETKALEPVIDTKTMEIHHGKHHQAYVDNLNKALAENTALQGMTLHAILRKIGDVPESIRTAVRNHGGGHLNHSMFWSIMNAPGKHGAGAAPKVNSPPRSMLLGAMLKNSRPLSMIQGLSSLALAG